MTRGRTCGAVAEPVGHLDRAGRVLGRIASRIAALEAGAGEHVHGALALVDVLLTVVVAAHVCQPRSWHNKQARVGVGCAASALLHSTACT